MPLKKNFRRHSPPSDNRRMKEMEKVALFIEEYNENEDVVFATAFVGVMDEESIYAKRVSNSSESDPEFIKVSTKDTQDCTACCEGLKEDFTARDMHVSEKDSLEDSRIIKEPKISEEIKESILEAVKLDGKE